MLRRLSLALALILATTAGMRSFPNAAPTMNKTRLAILTSVHGQITAGADSACARARLMQPDAILLVDDVTALQLGGYDTRAELIDNYRSWIRERPYVPMYGAINNWDYATANAGGAYNYAITAADSADPLADIRSVIPDIDWYGNAVTDVGLIRIIRLNTCFTSLGDSCTSQRRKWDPSTGLGTGFGGASNQDRAYQPASMYSNWNTYNSVGYNFVRTAIQSCTVPWVIIAAPNGFYPVQGDTTSSGVWCWNDAYVMKALLDSCRTALGYKIAAVVSGHQHCYWHITARGDSAIAYASGGIDHINGPPCASSHAPAIAAQLYAGQVSPDTCKVDSVALWQSNGGVNGALLQTITTGGKFQRLFTKPAWMVLDASTTQLTWTVYDSSGVKDTWTRGVR